MLKQIFAANDDTRSKISAIVTSIETARRALTSDPQTASDPHALALFNQFLDGQLAQIQQVLDSSKAGGKKQAELLAALGDEYRGTSGGGHSTDQDGGGGGDGGSGAGDGGGAGAGGTTTGAAAGGGLTDPLAGLGGAGMGDPLSMLGPAMAGLGSIPGALGGAVPHTPYPDFRAAELAGSQRLDRP